MGFDFSGLNGLGETFSSASRSIDLAQVGINTIQGMTFNRLLNGVFPHKKKSGAKIKGYIIDSRTQKIFKFQFNPQTMDYTRSANFAEVLSPGMQYPLTYFVNGGSKTFDLELFEYDRPTTGKINKDIEFLETLMPKMSNIQGYFTNPNSCIFAYGGFIAKCVVTGMKVHIDEYAQSGEPYMAHITLSMRVVDVPIRGNVWRYGDNKA